MPDRVFYVKTSAGGFEPTKDPADVFDLDINDYFVFDVDVDATQHLKYDITEIFEHFTSLEAEEGTQCYVARDYCGQLRDGNYRSNKLPKFGRLEAPALTDGAIDYVKAELVDRELIDDRTVISRERLKKLCQEHGGVRVATTRWGSSRGSEKYLDALAADGFVVTQTHPRTIEYDPARAAARLKRTAGKRRAQKAEAEKAEAKQRAYEARIRAGDLRGEELPRIIIQFCDAVAEGLALSVEDPERFDNQKYWYSATHYTTPRKRKRSTHFARIQAAERIWKRVYRDKWIHRRICEEVAKSHPIHSCPVSVFTLLRRVANRWPEGEPKRLLLFMARIHYRAQMEVRKSRAQSDKEG